MIRVGRLQSTRQPQLRFNANYDAKLKKKTPVILVLITLIAHYLLFM
jgi:hypothetical protein